MGTAWLARGWHGMEGESHRAGARDAVFLAELTERVKFTVSRLSLLGLVFTLRPRWRGLALRRLTFHRLLLLPGPSPRRLKRLQPAVPGLTGVAVHFWRNRRLLGGPDRGRAEQDREQKACRHAGTGAEAR